MFVTLPSVCFGVCFSNFASELRMEVKTDAALLWLGGSAYLFILHRSTPVVMSSSHSTCGCIASIGTRLCGTAYLFILHRSLPVVTSSSHSTCGCISSVGTGLCGTAYIFVLHRSLPVLMSPAHVTRWCSTSVGTGLWPADLLQHLLGCVGLPTFSFFTIHLL